MDGLTLRIRVRPGTSRTRVGGAYGDDHALVVAVQARAVDGAANAAVVEALAEAFDLPRRAVTIRAGHSSRSKVVHLDVADADAHRAQATLVALLDD
jgi:uncharacterized protein (TIGR00251 family)